LTVDLVVQVTGGSCFHSSCWPVDWLHRGYTKLRPMRVVNCKPFYDERRTVRHH